MSVIELDQELEAEKALAEELRRYAGEWVAVREHQVVAHAASLEELLEQISEEEVEGTFQVPEGDPAPCFF
jgi:hypothetical protein